MMRFREYILLALITSLWMGCQPVGTSESGSGVAVDSSQSEENESPQAESSDSLVNAKKLSRGNVYAKIASWEQVEKQIQAKSDKIVVVDIWSSWCDPCLREFPHLVALQKKYPEQVVAISFNVNYDGSADAPPESDAEDIMKFLAEHQAEIHNYISSTPDEEFYEKVDLASIPAVFVYAPGGALKQRFNDDVEKYGQAGFSYEKHITPLVESLLTQKGTGK